MSDPSKCPMPDCGRDCHVFAAFNDMRTMYYVRCAPVCGYRCAYRQTREQAIALHNLFAERCSGDE